MGCRVRAVLQAEARLAPDPDRQRPRRDRCDIARSTRWLQAHRAPGADRHRAGPAARRIRRGRRGLETAATHGHGRIRSGPRTALSPGAGQGVATPDGALAACHSARHGHRSAGRPDALHGGCHRRASLWRRGHDAGQRWRCHPAASGQDFSGAVQPHDGAAAHLALGSNTGSAPARGQRGGGQCGGAGFRCCCARSPAGRSGPAPGPGQFARGHAGRCRRAGQWHRRCAGGRQRDDHVAGGRGHHGQYAGLDDRFAVAPP